MSVILFIDDFSLETPWAENSDANFAGGYFSCKFRHSHDLRLLISNQQHVIFSMISPLLCFETHFSKLLRQYSHSIKTLFDLIIHSDGYTSLKSSSRPAKKWKAKKSPVTLRWAITVKRTVLFDINQPPVSYVQRPSRASQTARTLTRCRRYSIVIAWHSLNNI